MTDSEAKWRKAVITAIIGCAAFIILAVIFEGMVAGYSSEPGHYLPWWFGGVLAGVIVFQVVAFIGGIGLVFLYTDPPRNRQVQWENEYRAQTIANGTPGGVVQYRSTW